MAVFNSFIFDGVNSLESGIYITGQAVYNAPERSVEMVSVPGKNGDIAIDRGRFENIEVTYPAGAFAAEQAEFGEKIARIRNILASRYTYKRLEDTYNPDEYRLALYKSGLDVDPAALSSAGEFEITFNCKPQRFLKSGDEEETFTAAGTIENPTDFTSKPLLLITGYGQLTIGQQTFTIAEGAQGASQQIYIDCESQEAWEYVGTYKQSRNDYIQNAGQTFPELAAGVNDVLPGANISRIKIIPRWWRI